MGKTKYLIIVLALFLVVLPFVAKPQPIKVAGQEKGVKGARTTQAPTPTPEPTKPPQVIYVQPQVYVGTTPVPTQKPVQNVTNVTNVYAPSPTETPTATPTQAVTPTPVPDSITIKAGSDTWTATLIAGESAFDAIKREVGGGLTYDTYDCCGAFVTGFNGIAAVYPQWWEFFINGASSNVGVSYYIPVNGDVLEFKFHE
jgi:hypothetical protein